MLQGSDYSCWRKKCKTDEREMTYSRFLSRRVFSAISQSHHEGGGAEHEGRPTLLRKKCLKGITDNGTNRQWNGM